MHRHLSVLRDCNHSQCTDRITRKLHYYWFRITNKQILGHGCRPKGTLKLDATACVWYGPWKILSRRHDLISVFSTSRQINGAWMKNKVWKAELRIWSVTREARRAFGPESWAKKWNAPPRFWWKTLPVTALTLISNCANKHAWHARQFLKITRQGKRARWVVDRGNVLLELFKLTYCEIWS